MYILAFVVIVYYYSTYRKFYLLLYCWSEWRHDYFVNLSSFGKFVLYVSDVSCVMRTNVLTAVQYI